MNPLRAPGIDFVETLTKTCACKDMYHVGAALCRAQAPLFKTILQTFCKQKHV